MKNRYQNRNNKKDSSRPRRAAEYVRMSTDLQDKSIENQQAAIREYAVRNNIEVVRTYSDGGKSGLSVQGRDAFQQMMEDVKSGKADFEIILIYDISRWGRFQNLNESGHYEYICEKKGITLEFCGEQFINDGTLGSALMKQMKRIMAGEYSRELSAKVFRGQCRLIELGFRQGGHAGLGLRRMLVDHTGRHKQILERGEYKSLQTDRVILVPGPKTEVQTVLWMYRTYIEGKTEKEIADILNSKSIKTDLDRPWTADSVRQVLTNEKYIGDNVFNRNSFKLKFEFIKNPPDQWVCKREAFAPIVSRKLFSKVQRIMAQRSRCLSDEDLLEKLKALYHDKGYVSGILIDEADDMPSSGVYRDRFGSLIRAYQLIGYTPEQDYRYIEINKHLRNKHTEEVENVKRQLQEMGANVRQDEKTGLLHINDEFTVSLVIARCFSTEAGSLRWRVRLEQGYRPDITLVIRMGQDNKTIKDFYLLPTIDMTINKLTIKDNNGIILDVYRFDNLDFFFGMAKRTRLKGAA